MKTTVERIQKNQVALEVEVDEAKLEQALEQAYRKVVKKVNIPGFRKGKVPRPILEARLGKEVLYEDAIELIIPEAYSQAVKEAAIDPVDQPDISIVQLESGRPFIFKATVTVKPEVELGQYKEIEAEKLDIAVTDEDVQNYLERLQQRHAKLVALEEGTVEKGDQVTIDFVGTINGEPFAGGKANEYNLEIGSGTFIPGFEEQLIGAAIGEEREVKATFPTDYYVQDLAGQDAVFQVTVKGIKRKELSPIDDEFAKDVSEFSTLEELKADVAKSLQQGAEARAKRAYEEEVVRKVVEAAQVDIPTVMIDQKAESMVDEFGQRLRFQGISLEQYLQFSDLTREQLKQQFWAQAEQAVKTNLVLEQIAKVEQIEVSDEDFEREVVQMAEQYQRDPVEMRKTMLGIRDSLDYRIKLDKVVKFLVEQSKSVVKPVTIEGLTKATEEEKEIEAGATE
ncbi:MAG: trigger factor [Firmicutes bacterium]|nr:trigger factor [Bacillota bacterium]